MTTDDPRAQQIRVRTLGDRHGNKIKIKPDNNRPDRIYFRAPLMSLLYRDMAIEIANTWLTSWTPCPTRGWGSRDHATRPVL